MIVKAKVYRVMLASPSDVHAERSEFPGILNDWNSRFSAQAKAVLLPVRWETDSTPEMGNRPQAIITKQLVESSDILVAVFWTKLGTSTGVAPSGSIEEIDEFRQKGKPVLLYFSDVPVAPNTIDLKQYRKLKQYRNKCYAAGLVGNYNSLTQFRELLLRHLGEKVSRFPTTLPRPDNRIRAGTNSVVPMKYDAEKTRALVANMLEEARKLSPQARAELLRNLTQPLGIP